MRPEHRSRFYGPNSLLYHFNLHDPNILTPESFLQHSFIGAQSPGGRSRSFSADANSYAKDDGLDLLLLKQLSDAERDGDPIEANCLDRFFNRSNLDPPLLLDLTKSNLGHTEAKSRQTLNDQLIEFNRWLETKPINNIDDDDDDDDDQAFLQRISQQLLLKRTISFTHLAIFVFLNRQQLQEQINAFLTEQASPGLSIISRPTKPLAQKICFVFSGHEMTNINNGEWRLLEELIEKKNEQESRINDTNIAQPTLFAIQVALAALLVSWNIYPSSIIPHSAGDQAAAFVAGRLTLEETVHEAANVFLEISSHPILGTSIHECCELTNQQQSSLILPTLKRKENEQITLFTSLAQLSISSHVWQQYFHRPVAYLELATTASQQLLSSKEDDQQQQPTIIFEDINFTKALILNEHELVEVFTQIIMPMREWYIIFCNQDNLNKYLLNQFTLHAQGKIEINFKEQKSLTIPNT
ncbi:unnamed protein product [Adineta steineri]|uniref:Malonyl-CoA:ACP transacylase (MAT) domain-containing protein n=1 Tax=Adineta steineri TaxID=433720 RepID=A0A819S415_9BILA|nr:unnamed protein product [Adineta steineri]CAF4056770.1 unnamed protein product [Adineta steineri]